MDLTQIKGMDYCNIGGIAYDVLVVDIKESFDILYTEDTGRTLAAGAPMLLTPIGTFYNYNVTFARKNGHEKSFDDLFEYVSQPRSSGIRVSIVHGQNNLQFEAYISKGNRQLQKIDPKTGKVYWGQMTLNIIPIRAQVEAK